MKTSHRLALATLVAGLPLAANAQSIKRDDKKNLTAFAAKIDGKDYEFPKDACKGK